MFRLPLALPLFVTRRGQAIRHWPSQWHTERLVCAKLLEPASQLIGLHGFVPIRLRLVSGWLEPDLRNPFVAVNRSRPPPPSSPMEAMVTGDDRQCTGAGMTAYQFFQQIVCFAAAGCEANPESVLFRGTGQARRCFGGIKDNCGALSLGVTQDLPEPIE